MPLPEGNERDSSQHRSNAALPIAPNGSAIDIETLTLKPSDDVVTEKPSVDGKDVHQKWQDVQLQHCVASRTESRSIGDAVDNEAAGQESNLRWYGRLSPLKGRKAPPIPKERETSHEHGASLLSKLMFHWMAPLMRVSAVYGWMSFVPILMRLTDRVSETFGVDGYLASQP